MSDKILDLFPPYPELISTDELCMRAAKVLNLDDKYDDHSHAVRSAQQHLKKRGLIAQACRGYWRRTA